MSERYDPAKVEAWVAGGSGFWRKGEVNTTEHLVDFVGTWEQVRDFSDKIRAMNCRHGEAKATLEQACRVEYQDFLCRSGHPTKPTDTQTAGGEQT